MPEPFDVRRPFTPAQFRAAGHDPALLRRSEYRKVLHGALVHRAGIDSDTAIRAALLIHPDGAIASHYSAARLWGLPVPHHVFEHVTVFDPADRKPRPEVKSHVTTRHRRIETIRGIPVTDLPTTFTQMAGRLSLVDLVILGDALVRRPGWSAQKLRDACRSSTDYYARAARAAAELVRDGVDSVMETRLRLLIVLGGLPEPEVNVVVRFEGGAWRRRYDLLYRRVGLIVEYDGRQHAADTAQWQRDLARREEIDDADQRILVITSPDIFVRPQQTLQRIRRQLVLRGWGDVPPIDDGWQRYFAA